MSKTKTQMKNQKCTCTNPGCGRVFTKPIMVQDLCSENIPSYSACPYCLTEFSEEEILITPKKQKQEMKESLEKEKVRNLEEEKPTHEVLLDEKKKCNYHFGYLGKRSKNEEIPDECMICEKIVDCMLKTLE